MIYPVIENAKRNDGEPQAWRADVVARIGEGWPAACLAQAKLMARNWQATNGVDRLAAL